jgi:NitT/TauT family transport system ATP-binding protein
MPSATDFLAAQDLSKIFVPGGARAPVRVFEGLSFSQPRTSFVAVVGPSGCGKTTLLKIIGGLVAPSAGEVILNGRVVVEPPGDLILVFQDYSKSLLPWMTVEHNVALGLSAQDLSPAETRRRAERAIAMVGLDAARDRYPWELSGGMQQRAAMARAIACEPAVLLLDEPFSSLDTLNRSRLEDELLRLWAALGMTVLLITHDVDEAVYLADRVLILGGSPARITADVPIPLSRPRDQVRTRSDPAFSAIRSQIYRALLASAPQLT